MAVALTVLARLICCATALANKTSCLQAAGSATHLRPSQACADKCQLYCCALASISTPAIPRRLIVLQVEAPVSRRGAAATLAAGLALLSASPASAFLGFGEPSKEDVYKDETVRYTMPGSIEYKETLLGVSALLSRMQHCLLVY